MIYNTFPLLQQLTFFKLSKESQHDKLYEEKVEVECNATTKRQVISLDMIYANILQLNIWGRCKCYLYNF